jgi:hypothetical protein
MTKTEEEKNTAEIKKNFFWIKIAIFLCPSYRMKPLALKREHPALQNMKFINCFSMFVYNFCPLDPDPDTDPGTLLNPDSIRILIRIRLWIHNTGSTFTGYYQRHCLSLRIQKFLVRLSCRYPIGTRIVVIN